MESDLHIKNGVSIPLHELDITASRAGGPGGQHVNKTSTRITLRWNIPATTALSEIQKTRVLQKLESRLTKEGDLIIHNSSSRSQGQNRENALKQLAKEINKALHVPKRRMKTKVPKSAKESRLREKAKRGEVKKMRKKKFDD